jgi:hypothetical protein
MDVWMYVCAINSVPLGIVRSSKCEIRCCRSAPCTVPATTYIICPVDIIIELARRSIDNHLVPGRVSTRFLVFPTHSRHLCSPHLISAHLKYALLQRSPCKSSPTQPPCCPYKLPSPSLSLDALDHRAHCSSSQLLYHHREPLHNSYGRTSAHFLPCISTSCPCSDRLISFGRSAPQDQCMSPLSFAASTYTHSSFFHHLRSYGEVSKDGNLLLSIFIRT